MNGSESSEIFNRTSCHSLTSGEKIIFFSCKSIKDRNNEFKQEYFKRFKLY